MVYHSISKYWIKALVSYCLESGLGGCVNGASSELAEKFAQNRLFGRGEDGELSGDGFDNLGKELRNETPSLVSQVNGDEAAIFRAAFAAHMAIALQIVDDEGEVAGALEELGSEFRRADRAAMEQDFQHTELGHR